MGRLRTSRGLRMGSFVAPWLCALPLLSACPNNLTERTEVVRPRIMAGRIEVEGDPTRATPQPGETALLRLQVGFPARPPATQPLLDLGAAFCLTFSLSTGERFCLAEVPVDYELVTTGPDELALRYTVPDLDEVFANLPFAQALFEEQGIYISRSDFPELSLLGSLCVEGTAVRDPDADLNETRLTEVWHCEYQDEEPRFPYVISFTKTLARLDFENHNPSLACDADVQGNACDGTDEDARRVQADIVLVRPVPDGEPAIVAWPEPPADLAERSFVGCRDREGFGEDLRVHVGDDAYHVRLRFDEGDRESLPDDPDRPADASDVEDLLVYAALTRGGGSIDSALRLLTGDDEGDALEVDFEYEPAGSADDVELSLPEDGRIIRFYFAVLDGRGGADFTTRALCLLPED